MGQKTAAVEVNNLSSYRVSSRFLQEIAAKMLRREKRTDLGLSIALVGEKDIQKLNKKYRKKDKPTDVLSFSYGDSGEVVICPAVVKENAKLYKLPFKTELARVLTHGILHILGYTHKEMARKY